MSEFFDSNESMVVTVVGVVVALWVIVSLLLKIWPFLTKFVTMVNGIVGHGDEPGLLDRVKVLEENSEQESRNHQKMSAQFDRVEAKLESISYRMDASEADRQKLWELARTHHQEIEK